MSLLEPFAILYPALQKENVFVALRADASPVASQPVGSGKWNDPFGGTSGNWLWLDYLMNSSALIPDGSNVSFGPGTFTTRGWTARNMSKSGAGVGCTVVKLDNSDLPTQRWAISGSVSSFSLTDLTIDCGYTAATTLTTGAISLSGTAIQLRRVRAINFGSNGPSIATSWAVFGITSSGNDRCIIDSCIAENFVPTANQQRTCYMFQFANSSTTPHRNCVIRNCAARGVQTFEPAPQIPAKTVGVVPGRGFGTIVEGNQIINVSTGIYADPSLPATQDVIIRNNYLRNAAFGVQFDGRADSADPVGRVICQDNIIETNGDVSDGVKNPVGIVFSGLIGTDPAARFFRDVVLRANLIRYVKAGSPPAGMVLYGINVVQASNVVVEGNVIKDVASSNAVTFKNLSSTKFFNNQTPTGASLWAYNSSSGARAPQLEDRVTDNYLGLMIS